MKISRTALQHLATTALLALTLMPATAAPPARIAGADAFFQQSCIACHSGATAQAGFDLTKLTYDPANADNFAAWVKVYDRVSAGEMPPRGLPRPPAASLTPFLKDLATHLTQAETAVAVKAGRAGLRRLNAYEYENAIRDLLAVPWLRIKDKLPQDGIAYRFNKTGRTLDVSHVQVARYMSIAQLAMREAIAAKLVEPPTTTTRVYARQEPTLVGNMWPREGTSAF